MMREAVLAEGGEGGGQGKLTSCLRYSEENVLPVKTTTVCLCTFGDGGGGVGWSPFSFGWVWWVGGSTTGSAGSAHGLRDLFHEASRDTDLLVRARWALRAQPLQLRDDAAAAAGYCARGGRKRFVSFFIFSRLSFFHSPCFFPSSSSMLRLLLPPQSSSIRTPSCGRPSHPLFFYPPVSAKRSNTWPWLGVAPSHDAAPPRALKSC